MLQGLAGGEDQDVETVRSVGLFGIINLFTEGVFLIVEEDGFLLSLEVTGLSIRLART